MAIVTRNTARTVDHLHSSLWCPSGLSRFSPAISRDAPPGMPAKPHPAALESIAREWGVPLDEGLLMVGDSPANDVGFGRAAGVSTALLDTGRRHVEGGSDGGADLVVDALGRLPHLLGGRRAEAGALRRIGQPRAALRPSVHVPVAGGDREPALSWWASRGDGHHRGRVCI